jgi:hypothetical protein
LRGASQGAQAEPGAAELVRQGDRPHRVVLVAADEDHQVPTRAPSIAARRVEQAEDVAAEALAAARGFEVVDALGQVVDV